MSDMSKFKVGANTYDIKDEKSRGVSLTWAQYQALSYEEQHNGTAYYITDMDAVYPVDHELNANSRNAVANDIVTPHILAMENVLGAKNLLPNQSADGTENGLTFTTNADGSITVNGTATATTNHIIYYTESTPDWLLNKDLIFSGCTGGASQGKYRLWMGDKTWDGIVECTDGDRNFNISQNKGLLCIIQVVNNVTMNNVTFYPMIRPAGTDPTYVPYAMTNRELTERVEVKTVTGTTQPNGAFPVEGMSMSKVGIPIGFRTIDNGGHAEISGYFITSGLDNWFLMVKDVNGQAIGNATLTFKIAYIPTKYI